MTRLLWLVFWCVLTAYSSVDAATYYVATTGSDSNNGSTGSPWRNPQKCAIPPVTAGDTCIVRNGTYSASPQVILISSSQSSAAGTSTNPITIKAENDHGAKLIQPTRVGGPAVAIYISQPYYIIEGFEIDGTSTVYDTGANASHAGIGIYASNTTVRRNHIHHIARTQCSNSVFGNSGVFINTGLSNILVEKNLIHTVGRLRNGESGCSTTLFQNDHGIYITWGTDITIQRNVCYDANRGFCLNIYSASTSVHTRYKILNNTFAGRSPTGSPSGQMIIGGIWTNGQIKNNLFYQPDADQIIQTFSLSASSSGNTVSFNRTNLNLPGADFLFGTATPTGFSSTNNTENSALGLTSALCTQADGGCENFDFTLAAGSNAIGTGTNVGLPCNAGCDQGAFQTFNFSSCEIPNGAANTIRVTFTSNANLLGSTLTTFTARLNAANNPLTGAPSKIGDTIISLPLTNTYVGGNTGDISWSSGGLTDDARIGGTLTQPFVQTLTNQSCTNNAAGAAAYVLTQSAFRYEGVFGLGVDARGSENQATISVVQNGGVLLRIGVVDSVANAPSFGLLLRYSKDGGGYTLVPSSFGADGIAMCEDAYPNIGFESGSDSTKKLSLGGSFVPGANLLHASAIPTITGLNIGLNTEIVYCVRWNAGVTGSFSFRVYDQNGSAIGAYTVTPTVTIIPSQANGG